MHIQQLEPNGNKKFSLESSQVIKMKANMADAPYIFEKTAVTTWAFTLAYAPMDQFLPLALEQLAISRLAYRHRDEALQVGWW